MKMKVRLNEELIKRLDDVFGRTWARLSEDIDVPRSTLYRIKDRPSGIDMQQLLAIANGLKIPVRKFFYTGNLHTVNKREDYVADPYLPCRYEHETLRNIVESRRDITWVKAYEVIGITKDNLKNSLLSEEAPVVRFLDFCDAFGIAPFDVLIDPNPRQKKTRRTADSPTLLSEVADLRRQMTDLVANYRDIAGRYDNLLLKYSDLLDAHKTLLRRFDEHIEDVT